jgi:predicted small secreted protein
MPARAGRRLRPTKEHDMVTFLVRGALGSVLAIGLAAGLGGCNTMEGFGKDMSAAGRALSSSAERNKGDSTATTSGAEDATSSTAATPGTGSSVTPVPLK